MGSCRFKGRRLTDFDDAFEVFLRFFQLAPASSPRVALGFETPSAETLAHVLDGTSIRECSVECDATIPVAQFQDSQEVSTIENAWVRWGSAELSISEHFAFPDYDWDEQASSNLQLLLLRPQPTYPSGADWDRQAAALSDLLSSTLNQSVIVRHTGIHSNDSVSVSYGFDVPRPSLGLALSALGRECPGDHITGRVRFRVPVSSASTCVKQHHSNFATEKPSDPVVFCVHPTCIQHPALNCSLDEAKIIGRRAWDRRSEILFFAICRAYLPWTAQPNQVSTRTRFNTLDLCFHRGKLNVSVSVAKYADEDPPTRPFLAELRKVATKLGGTLT